MKSIPEQCKSLFPLLLAMLLGSFQVPSHAAPPLYGFTTFPHDLTPESIGQVHAITNPNSTLYALHADQCIPWHQVLAKQPFPQWLQDSWSEVRPLIPQGRPVYLAVTPTQNDRISIAKACGDEEGKEVALPKALENQRLNSAVVKQAYVDYVQRVIELFNPAYVNIAIEISELALKNPAGWPDFQNLYLHTLKEIKSNRPQLKVGLEMVLQTLMSPKVSALVKPAVEQSDYLGISFYPDGNEYGIRVGVQALPQAPEQWRSPLAWLKGYTKKPIGICETGFTTKDVHLQRANIWFRGNEQLQRDFLTDLIGIAKADNYLFVIWFIPVDYERLLEKWPGGATGASEWLRIWGNHGLFDRDLKPKPAWPVWQGWEK